MKLVIEKGADVNLQIKSGCTALILAADRGYETVIKLLIEKGADVNHQLENDGATAPMLAAEKDEWPS